MAQMVDVAVGGKVPPGAPPGGTFETESYCGTTTQIMALVACCFFWPALFCIPCCKCDSREIYKVNGVHYDLRGQIVN